MRSTNPFPHVPIGSFKVKVQPLEESEQWIDAVVNPIVVTMEEGSGSIDLISGFEVKSDRINGAVGWSELDWLIESGQFRVV